MSTMCILDPLGIQFVQVYGQAHVLRLLPDSQASRLLNFQPNMMLTAVNGVCIASMEYDDVVAMVCSTVRPMTLSLVYAETARECPFRFPDCFFCVVCFGRAQGAET